MVVTRQPDVLQRIEQLILSGELRPGAALSEQRLAVRLGVSRTPVREAFKVLARDQLVQTVPRRGTFVADLTAADVIEIYELRLQLEPYAARVAALSASGVEREQLVALERTFLDAAEGGRLEAAFAFDVDLHKAVLAATRNGRLREAVGLLDRQVQQVRRRSERAAGRVEVAVAEHRAIVDAVVSEDPDTAERAMREHLANARDAALSLLLPATG